jgi:hypothetical protein
MYVLNECASMVINHILYLTDSVLILVNWALYVLNFDVPGA